MPDPVTTLTRTLLLTDLEGSTELSRRLGDTRMAEVWTEHDRLARDLLPAHGGLEIDRTDGFLLLFEEVPAAVAYARAYHAAIAPFGLRARAGVHVGPVVLRHNPPEHVRRGAKPIELDGLAKPLAARVMATARGGQTLLSADARAALGSTPAHSHGHWRFRGLLEPVELFEVGEGVPVPPADGEKGYRVVRVADTWLPAREVPRALPAERDAFVGRGEDLLGIDARLEAQGRLVTLLGIGGTGKTRLAVHYAWRWLGDWPGGAWFCDLSEARDLAGVVLAVAATLGVPLGASGGVDLLGDALASRGRCLVVLDNFEQVARAAEETVGAWLERCPEARFLVTSREVLGVVGETTLALPPLPLAEGVELFLRRARDARRGFEPGPGDLDHIEHIVRMLDSLPLAVELAAARVRVLAPAALRERLHERFRLLAAPGGRQDRHATLKATLDWSWDLLNEAERSTLAQLSVFEGGFSVEAAEAVLALPPEAPWVLDLLQSLVDKSLLRTRELGAEAGAAAGSLRFDLLVSVQLYTAERAAERGERAGAELRHAAWLAPFGERAALDALDLAGGHPRRLALFVEIDNLQAAVRRALERGDGPTAARLALALGAYFELRGPYAQASRLYDEVLGLPLPAALEVDVLRQSGRMKFGAGGDPEVGREHARRAVSRAVAAGDLLGEARARGELGSQLLNQGEPDAAGPELEEACAVARRIGSSFAELLPLSNLAGLAHEQGRVEQSEARYEAATALARRLGARRVEGAMLCNYGIVLGMRDARLGLAAQEAGLAIHREIGNPRFEAVALGNMGYFLTLLGEYERALEVTERSLETYRRIGFRPGEGIVVTNLGMLSYRLGRLEEARRHYAEARTLLGGTGDLRSIGTLLGNEGLLLAELGELDAAQADFDEGEAHLRQIRELAELGLLLAERVALELARGDRERAGRCLAEAEAIAGQVGSSERSELGLELARARARLG